MNPKQPTINQVDAKMRAAQKRPKRRNAQREHKSTQQVAADLEYSETIRRGMVEHFGVPSQTKPSSLVEFQAETARRQRVDKLRKDLANSGRFTKGTPFRVTRSKAGAAITAALATWQYGSVKFQLNELPGYTELTSIFDQYRVIWLKYSLIPADNVARIGVAGDLPYMLVAVDTDDNNVPGSYDQLSEYEGMQIHQPTDMFTIQFKPHCATSVYQGAFTGYAEFDGWIDCGYPAVEFYGWKYALSPDAATTANQIIRVFVTAVIEFRDVR